MVNCKRCHRELRNPQSIIDGYGPVCYVKEFGKKGPIIKRKEPEEEYPNVEYLFEDDKDVQTKKY